MSTGYSKGALGSSLVAAPKGNSPLSGRKRSRAEATDAAVPISAPTDALSAAFARVPSADAHSRRGSDLAAAAAVAAATATAAAAAAASNYKSRKNKEADDAEKLNRTVFVGNVPIVCDEKALKRFLREALGEGCIESLRYRSVAVAGTKVSEANNYKLYRKASAIQGKYNPERDSKNAYVVFKTEDLAEDALDLNGCLFQERHLRFDRADGASSRKKHDHKKSIFLGNLPFNVDEEQVHSFFAKGVSGGEKCIKGVRIVRDRGNNMGIGIGYVLFADADYVTEAVALNGTKFQNREIRVRRCRKNAAEKSNRGAKRRAAQNHTTKKGQFKSAGKAKGKGKGKGKGRGSGARSNWQGSKATTRDSGEVRKGLSNKRRKLKANSNKHSNSGGNAKKARKPRSDTGRNASKK